MFFFNFVRLLYFIFLIIKYIVVKKLELYVFDDIINGSEFVPVLTVFFNTVFKLLLKDSWLSLCQIFFEAKCLPIVQKRTRG